MRAGDAASAEIESIVGDTKVGLRADIVGSLLAPAASTKRVGAGRRE